MKYDEHTDTYAFILPNGSLLYITRGTIEHMSGLQLAEFLVEQTKQYQ